MIARPKERIPDYPDLTPHETYFVIGIEADDLRILNETTGKMPAPPEKPHENIRRALRAFRSKTLAWEPGSGLSCG